jgi:hypothetical protein
MLRPSSEILFETPCDLLVSVPAREAVRIHETRRSGLRDSNPS